VEDPAQSVRFSTAEAVADHQTSQCQVEEVQPQPTQALPLSSHSLELVTLLEEVLRPQVLE